MNLLPGDLKTQILLYLPPDFNLSVGEHFWKEYDSLRGWQPQRPEDTWYQTAMLGTLGYRKYGELILDDIVWDIDRTPKPYKVFGLFNNGKQYPIIPKFWDEIIFRDPITIQGPKGDQSVTFTLEPDTPVGSSLGHVLTEIYQHLHLPDSSIDRQFLYLREIRGVYKVAIAI